MNVRWRLPDGSEREQTVTDPEQLLFVLRMVGGVAIDGIRYGVALSTLEVDGDTLYLAVSLE